MKKALKSTKLHTEQYTENMKHLIHDHNTGGVPDDGMASVRAS